MMRAIKGLVITTFMLCISFIFCGSAYGYTEVSRISGDDRYKTAVEISRMGWQSSENVILATGENFPDALCSIPLARLLNAPVLLTGASELNMDTLSEIERLKVHHVYITGGPGVVSDNVQKTLEDMGLSCTRLSGSDRYETSAAIAQYMAANFSIDKEVVLVTGDDYSDAVSVSSAAAKKNMPVLLASGSYLSKSTGDFIFNNGVNKVFVIGDDDIISDDITKVLPNAERISGGDRYQRNAVILSRFQDILNFNTVYFATGEDFPDALACSALASKNASPVILVNQMVSETSRSFIDSKLPIVKSAVAVGGTNVVSDAVIDDIARESIVGPGLYGVKPFDEFEKYLMDNLSSLSFDGQRTLKMDNISVFQDSGSDDVNIYLDMNPDSYNSLKSWIDMGDSSAKDDMECWIRVICYIASEQYQSKTVNGILWNVQSFGERPSSYSDDAVKFNPSTGKWEVMNSVLVFSRSFDGGFKAEWSNQMLK